MAENVLGGRDRKIGQDIEVNGRVVWRRTGQMARDIDQWSANIKDTTGILLNRFLVIFIKPRGVFDQIAGMLTLSHVGRHTTGNHQYCEKHQAAHPRFHCYKMAHSEKEGS